MIGLFLALVGILAASPAKAVENMDYSLSNGLRVILLENHRAPVVSMLVWVKTGSASESAGEYGLAHLLEHMAFKGTTTRGPGQVAREIEAAGGHVNAYTTFDQTVYYIDMASRYALHGLEVLGDMVLNPALDPEELSREKEVVIEEIRRGEDSPESRLSKALFRQAYRVHPYGRPIIGFEESVRNVSRETVVGFHRRWYQPANMILVVSGDFSPDQFRTAIEKWFGRTDGVKGPSLDRPQEPKQTAPAAEVVRADVKTARISLGFHIPGFTSEQVTNLDLLAMIAGQGRTSRLYQKVRRQLELVNEITASTYTPRDPGLWVVSAQLTPEKLEAALKAVLKELWILAGRGVTSEELQRAKLNAKAEFLQSRATMSGEAQTAAHYEAFDGDYHLKDRYLQEVDQATGEALKVLASQYLRPENLTVTVMLPNGVETRLDQTALLNLVTTSQAEMTLAPKAASEGSFKKYQMKNGVRLLVKADSSLPLVSVRAAFLGGARYETDRDTGLTNFLSKVWDKGTSRLSPEALARETEDVGASLTSFSGYNAFGLEGEFLGQYLGRSLELFSEVLLHPALDQAEVDKARTNIKAAILRQRDDLPSRTFKLFRETLFTGHPYGRDILGTEATVNRLTAQDLRSYYLRFVRPDNAVIAVVGDVDPDWIKTRLEELLAGWDGRAGSGLVIGPPSAWTGLKAALDPVDRAQAHFVRGFLAADMASPDRYALEVLNAVLSGQGGRMFIKLRDEQGLAYALGSFYRPGLGTGSFGLYIAFEPAKLDKVQAGIQELLAEITQKSVTAAELEGAKQYILGNFEVGQQTYGAQASEAVFSELYGLGYEYQAKYLAGISAVTAEDVARVAKHYLNPNQAAQVIVGKIQNSK